MSSGARADELETVTVGGIQLPTNAPLFIAMDKGYFAKQAIKVTTTWFTAASSVFSAVVSRDVDVAATGTTAATYNLASKGGFKIIGGTTRDAPHFPLNAVLASNKAFDAGFTSVDKLAGKRFAMTTAGSTHHYDIGMLAKKYGVALPSVPLVPLEAYGNIVAALQSNQVDGAILPPALAKRMLDAKTAHFLAWTGDEVPEQQGIICASPQTIARKHDTLVRFMRAYAEGAGEYNRVFNQVDASGTPGEGGGLRRPGRHHRPLRRHQAGGGGGAGCLHHRGPAAGPGGHRPPDRLLAGRRDGVEGRHLPRPVRPVAAAGQAGLMAGARRTAIVTGGCGALGYATALRLARNGVDAVLVDRDADAVRARAAGCGTRPARMRTGWRWT